MSGEADRNLSGTWSGLYTYADGMSVPFEAELLEIANRISGSVREEARDGLIGAHVDGEVEGDHVRFLKTYDRQEGGYDYVLYEGTADKDGLEIAGGWRIPGSLSGTFLMVRPASGGAAVEAEEAVTVTE